MVDAILEMERLKRVVGVKNITNNGIVLPGPFPGKPIFPGVLIIEAMAQTGGLLLLQEVPDREKQAALFRGGGRCALRRPVVPGDQLRLEVTVPLGAGRRSASCGESPPWRANSRPKRRSCARWWIATRWKLRQWRRQRSPKS